jgi:hypothetical protein
MVRIGLKFVRRGHIWNGKPDLEWWSLGWGVIWRDSWFGSRFGWSKELEKPVLFPIRNRPVSLLKLKFINYHYFRGIVAEERFLQTIYESRSPNCSSMFRLTNRILIH